MAIVSGGDTAPVFEAAKEALDDVSPPIDTAIERVWCPPCGCGRDDGLNVSGSKPRAQAVGIIGFVGEQAPGRSDRTEQRYGDADVSDVARCQGDGDRSAAIVGQAVDLACPASARTADRFFILPLFEPAAERWALT